MVELADYLIEHDPNFRKARLPALYSDFRHQKSLNPDGYRANVGAWRGALARLASHGLLAPRDSSPSLLVLKVEASLLQILEHRRHGQPLALGTAISEAAADHGLVPLQNFFSAPQGTYPRNRTHFLWGVVTRTLRQLGIIDASSEDKLPVGQYVIMDNVRIASKALAERTANQASRLSRVFTKSQFREEFASNLIDKGKLSELDTNVLLTFLHREPRMIEYDGQTIRFRRAGEPEGVTDEDAAMASIKELTASLQHQIQSLTSRIDETRQEAMVAVARKNRVAALATLKSKKVAESALAMRYATLNQLEEIAAKIEQASDQDQLVKILEASADVLKNHHASIGDADKIHGIMDRLREHTDSTNELSALLADSLGHPLDEAEIDEELEVLVAQDEDRRHQVQRLQQDESEDAGEPEAVQRLLESLPPVPASPVASRMPASEMGMRTSS